MGELVLIKIIIKEVVEARDGHSIYAWTDKWVIKADNRKPTPPDVRPTRLTVATLMKEDRTWDEANIKQIFHEDDAKAILQIPLSPNQMKDRVVCPHASNGELTAKNAYMVARAALGKEVPDKSQTS